MIDLSPFYQAHETYDVYVWLAYALAWSLFAGFFYFVLRTQNKTRKKYEQLETNYRNDKP